jgi:hypothetical protein
VGIVVLISLPENTTKSRLVASNLNARWETFLFKAIVVFCEKQIVLAPFRIVIVGRLL